MPAAGPYATMRDLMELRRHFPWLLRAAWVILPLSAGAAYGAALQPHSEPVRLAAAVLLWAGWTAVLVGTLVPWPAGLTGLRLAARLEAFAAQGSAQTPRFPELSPEHGDVLQLPAASRATDIALDELEHVYAFIYVRVGNRADAEDLTQQVALKAIPRLRQGAPASAIRGYLFATARSVLGGFWSNLAKEEFFLLIAAIAAVPSAALYALRRLPAVSDHARR